jgi:hypothetical protein
MANLRVHSVFDWSVMKTNPDSLIHSFDGKDARNYNGLTKREYFAAIALQGLLSVNDNENRFIVTSSTAVKFADALIAELNKETK